MCVCVCFLSLLVILQVFEGRAPTVRSGVKSQNVSVKRHLPHFTDEETEAPEWGLQGGRKDICPRPPSQKVSEPRFEPTSQTDLCPNPHCQRPLPGASAGHTEMTPHAPEDNPSPGEIWARGSKLLGPILGLWVTLGHQCPVRKPAFRSMKGTTAMLGFH